MEEPLITEEIYLKAGIHIGTKFKTKYMEKFIYKTRSDGLSVLNVDEINKRITIAAKMIARYDPSEIVFIISDPNADKSALDDTFRAGIPCIAFCDTNNQTNKVDLVVPCNNKGKKSLGLVYYLLTKEYFKNKGKDEFKYTVEDFTEE